MPNGTYGGVRGRKTKVGRKLLRFPPTRLLSLTAAMPMSRAFQESGEGSEGRFANFFFFCLSSASSLLNSTLFCTDLPLSVQF